MKTTKRIRTVLYGDQRFSAAELEVLHTPAMQRLYGLKQLGLTDRIFIDASHARIHHVVGVLQQVDNLVFAIINSLRHSARPLRVGSQKTNQQTFFASKLAALVRKRRPVIRFIGLLHDLTHAPFGHTVEDEIQLVGSKHDEPSRQADAFYRLICQLIAWLVVESKGPKYSEFPESLQPFLSQGGSAPFPPAAEVASLLKSLLVSADAAQARLSLRLSIREIAEMFAHLKCAMTALLHLEALHKPKLKEVDLPKLDEYAFQSAIRGALQETPFDHLLKEFDFQPHRDAYMLDIVGNTVCADLLDYAGRDSHFAGLRLDYDPNRISENFTLVSLDASAYELSHGSSDAEAQSNSPRVPPGLADPFEGWCLRTAISLISHKYRTDVPSELMNLLNVRFYLYERVIYHPTKCAAGSMLGTALQLLGWRESASGERPSLPSHLRFVGDDVFLHDIGAALEFILSLLASRQDADLISPADVSAVAHVERVHSGLVPELLELRAGQTVREVREELLAARLLLNRLVARRYFRPVFRALPSSTDTRLQVGAEALAEVFRQPDSRYDAERRIEADAGLPLGTVTIHCPTRKTAKKIANVLLMKPGREGDETCKLKHIASLDPAIFGEHQKAVKAVEEMYGSMWRLTVYVAPEHVPRFKEIGEVAGRVIFKTIDVHGQFSDRQISWKNDPNIEKELDARMVAAGDHSGDEDELSSVGRLIGRISDDLIESGRLGSVRPELFGSPDDVPQKVRSLVEEALLGVLSIDTQAKAAAERNGPARTNEVLHVFRAYIKKPRKDDTVEFERDYAEILNQLSPQTFDLLLTDARSAIAETQTLDQRAQTVHRGYKFGTLLEVLDELLRKYGASSPPRARQELMGEKDE